MVNNKAYSWFWWEKKTLDGEYRGAPLHAHPEHELYFILSGSTTYFICDEVFVLHPGDMAFIPKGVLHQTEYCNNEGVERILFSFGDVFFEGEFACYLQEMTKNKRITFSQRELLKITHLVDKIEEEAKNNAPDSTIAQRVFFMQLLIWISRYRNKTKSPPPSKSLVQIQNILDYINQNHTDEITLSSLANHFSVSVSCISKNFKSATGIGIKECINLARVSAAKTLLETSDLSITEIAMKCGYNDSNYFAAVFKKIIGVTPKKYFLLYHNEQNQS